MLAVVCSKHDCALELLDQGADPNAKRFEVRTVILVFHLHYDYEYRSSSSQMNDIPFLAAMLYSFS